MHVCASPSISVQSCLCLERGLNIRRGTFCTWGVCVHVFVCMSNGFALAKNVAALL